MKAIRLTRGLESKRVFLYAAILCIVLVCVSRQLAHAADQSPGPSAKEQFSALEIPCLAPIPSNSTGLGQSTSELKAFGDKQYFWQKRTLVVHFLGGDPQLQNRVAKIASEWSQYADIRFNFGPSGPSDIRISFVDSGHWSRVGTDAKSAPASSATMNLQITNATPDGEVSRVTLHEFGHALGLMHEHRQPGNAIHWNKVVVAKWYAKPPNNWSESMIEEQVFKPYNSATTVSNGYHPDSIMHYPILPGWTTDGFTVGWNRALVSSDKEFIRQCYPKTP
jgi:serralysin